MILKIGSVNVAGPGLQAIETQDKSNFNVNGGSSRSLSCADVTESSKRNLGIQVYARGGCELGLARAYELAERIQTELDLANSHGGHTIYYKKLDNYTRRLELLGGAIDYNNFELQYTRNHTVAMDLNLSVSRSLILDSRFPASAGGYWDDELETIYAILVTDTSSVLTEPVRTHPTDYANFNEFGGTNYARVLVKGRSISGLQYLANDITFPRLGNDTDPIGGLVIYRDTGNPATSVINAVFRYNSNWGYTLDPGGSSITFRVNARGIMDAGAAVGL